MGRKTANVVLWGGFGMNTSLATGLMLVPLLWIFVGAGASFWVQMNLIRKTFSLD